MTDLTPQLLSHLDAHTLPNFPENDDWQLPDYQGLSIVNLPTSICQWLNTPEIGAGSLTPDISSSLAHDWHTVVLLLVDALSLPRFQHWIEDGTAPVWKQLLSAGLLAPLTSTVPSTTSTALPSLWTGHPPATHGMVGYEIWLKDFGIVTNMITQSPMVFKGASSLEKAGFEPEKMLPGPLLGAHLKAHGVDVHTFLHHSITNSGLSRTFLHEVDIHPFGTIADLWISLRQLLEAGKDQRRFIWVYWSALDGLAHRHGPDNERVCAEFSLFSQAFERFFLSRLDPNARERTLFLLTSDHGQIATPKNPHNELCHHPSLTRRLHLYPTGENRLIYLFIRPGQVRAVREYLHVTWPGQFTVLPPEQVVRSGLLGNSRPHPQLGDRLGDEIVIPHGNAYLWWANKENPLLGRHGGLSPEEMLVPLFALPL